MAETEVPQQQQKQDTQLSDDTKKPMNLSFSIWPPTQRTRDAVVNRLVETLTTAESILSKRYGTFPLDEASEVARRIEEAAFSAAAGSASTDDDGIEILQKYSKEISRRMLEAVKSRSAAGSTLDNASVAAASDTGAAASVTQEVES